MGYDSYRGAIQWQVSQFCVSLEGLGMLMVYGFTYFQLINVCLPF
jgi:hypothetical protein